MSLIVVDSYALTTLEDTFLADGLTALYKLDEASGTAVTDHAGTHTGTHEDTAYVTQGDAGPLGADGGTATTYTQHGSTPYGGKTTVPDSDDWAKLEYTVEAFFKSSDASNSRRRFMQQQAGGNYWFFGLENQIPEWGHTNDGIATFGGSGLCNGIWHHLLFQRRNGTNAIDCWVDGVERTTHMTGGGALNVAVEVTIANVCDEFNYALECARATLSFVAFRNGLLPDARVVVHARKGLNSPYVPVVTGDDNYGQAWTASATRNISQITLKMHKAAGATGTVTLKVYAGTDFGTVIGTSAAVDVSGFGTSRGDVICTFSTPVATTIGNSYRFALSGASIVGSVYLAIDRDGGYAGGDAFHFTSFPTYTTDTDHDIPFVTYYSAGVVHNIASSVSAGATALDRLTRERPLAGIVAGGASLAVADGKRLILPRLYAIPNASAVLGLEGTWTMRASATGGAAATCLLEDVASFAGVHAGAEAVCSLDWANMGILEDRMDEVSRQAAIMRCARCIRR